MTHGKIERWHLSLKSRGLVCSERRDIPAVFEFMKANQAMFTIVVMARVLGASRSGFHAWTGRAPSARDVADGKLFERIREIHDQSHRTYGAPVIHAELMRRGIAVGRKRVERLMKAASLQGVSRRKSARMTIGDERVRLACDLVERNFAAEAPGQAVDC